MSTYEEYKLLQKENKLLQKENTRAEVDRMLQAGYELVTLTALSDMLKPLGLHIDLKNWLTLKYYNTGNEFHYLECTTPVLGDDNVPFYNIYGKWYKENVIPQTEKRKELTRIREKYFCVLKSGHILST